MKRLNYALLILLITPSLLYANRMTLAVMDFKADGVSHQQARRISELIRTEMINTGRYIVVERKEINLILKEQGFQRTGCTDQDCAVKIGKLLSAKYMLIGTVMKFDDSIVINGRIVDVEKGVGLFGQKQSAKKGKMLAAVTEFTNKLTTKMTGEGIATHSHKAPVQRNEYSPSREIKNHPDYHSPFIAGLSSLLPFWSGSFNNGFDGWGLTLTLFKASAFSLATSFYVTKIANYDTLAEAKKANVHAVNASYSLIGVWIAFTLADVIYSSGSISKSNKRLSSKISYFFHNSEGYGKVSFNVFPRMNSDINKNQYSILPDGLNFHVDYIF